MSELITHTARLVPYTKRPKQVPSFVTAYYYEPMPDEPGSELGSLYVVLEVLVSGRASEEVADLIIETAGNHYYNLPPAGTEPLERLELAIKAVNHELTEHVNRGNAAWIGKLSAIIAIQVGPDLHLAATGSAEAFLYRGKSSTHITAGEPNRPTTPSKTFGSIASGQLEPSDRLLLATPALIHQIPLAKIKTIITEASPNSAIAELTDLLHGAATDRIAALIIEITTPELAALQVRSEQPSEIQLGTPENALEVAKLAAAPIADVTVASSRKVASAAQTSWRRAKPQAQAFSLALADRARNLLNTRKGQRLALIILGLITVVIAALIWRAHSSATASKTFTEYQQAYTMYTNAQGLISNGQKTEARKQLQTIQQHINDLKSHQGTIDHQLGNTPLPQGEPRTMKEFESLVGTSIDQIDGLVRVNYTTIATLPQKNAHPDHFEIYHGKAYIFDSANNNSLSIVDLASGQIKTSGATTTKLGNVVNTTLSASNDGVYILTSQPMVWFYRFDTDTLQQQSIAYGQWPTASAIASYYSNLYLLSDNAVYKHTKNATGFSPKTSYLTLGQGGTSLAIDGSIYVASSAGLQQYLSGALKQTTDIPATLGQPKSLRSFADGTIIGINPTSSRIGIWTATDTKLTFSKQIALNSVKSLTDASYDAKTNTVYATADGRLIRFTLNN